MSEHTATRRVAQAVRQHRILRLLAPAQLYAITKWKLLVIQEIQDLQSVAVPEHIGTNRIAQAAKASRYPITLSTYSFQLLMSFLQNAKLWLLLSIVNQHLKLQVCFACWCFQNT